MTEEKKHEVHSHASHPAPHASHTPHAAPTHTATTHSASAHSTDSKPMAMPEIPKVDLKGVTPDALKGGFMDVVEILKMNKVKMDAVAGRDSEGITISLVYLAIGAIAAPVGGAIFGYFGFRTSIVSALISAVVSVVLAAAVYYITNIVAVNLFKGKGSFPAYFRVMGYASLANVLGLLTMVSILGTVAGLYVGLVINFIALQRIHKLDTTNAVLTIIVSVVATAILGSVLAMVGLSAGVGMMMGGVGSSIR